MSRRPRLVPGCNVKSLPLTPRDAFLLSRADGTVDEQELALLTGFAPEEVAAMLDRLAALGAIVLTGGAASQTQLRAPPEPAAEDLAQMRRQVLARKLSGTHAQAGAGTPARRPITEPDAANVRRTSEALNAHYAEAADVARLAELAQRLDEGERALARRDFEGAINAYRLASSLAPEDPRVQATCAGATLRAAGALADGYWQRAVHEEREERWEDAALSYARVCAGRPGDALAHERVAGAALRSGNVRRAVEFARKAVELAPGSAIFHVTLARAYAAAGLATSAHHTLDRALELAPNEARIVNLVSRLRALHRSTGKTG